MHSHWPADLLLVMALLFGSGVVFLGLFLWRIVFCARRPGWFVDSLLLVGSGFAAIAALMIALFATANRFSKGTQRSIEEIAFVFVAGVLAALSQRVLARRSKDVSRVRTKVH